MLTDSKVRRLKLTKAGQQDHFDEAYPGLSLRVGKRRKTWCLVYRIGGKQKRLRLGWYPAMGVAEAHDKWRAARDEIDAGRDPGANRSSLPSNRFEDVFAEWLRRDQAGNRSAREVEHRMRRDVLPSWEGRDIATIGRRDVLDVIDRIADRGAPILARRVQTYIRRMFAWSVGRGIVELNPAANLPKPGSETKRDRTLTDEEFKTAWAEGIAPVRLLMLTGARRSEIGGLQWSEIQDDAIYLEGDRTKNGQPHIIPLSAPARAILDELPRFAGSNYVFGQTPISKGRWDRTRKALGDGDWTLHDIRRTVATGLQKLGTPLQVTEAILGHTAGSRAGVIGIYQRHTYADEKRAALQAWGAHVMDLIEGREPGKVVAMRGR